MRGHTLDRILASTALALILGSSAPVLAQTVENIRIEARAPDFGAAGPQENDVTKAIPANAAPSEPAPAPADQPAAAPAPVAEPAAAPAPVTEPAAAAAPAPAAEPVQAAQPAPSADQAFSDKLRELITSRNAARYFNRSTDLRGAEAFYKERNYAPLWVDAGKQSSRGAAAALYLQNVDADGLEPSDYPVPAFKAGDIDALAEAELRMTGEVLEFARHASTGRVHYSRISNDIGYDHENPDAAEILTRVAGAADVKVALDSFQPQLPQYKALKAKLAESRGRGQQPQEEIVRIPDGQKFKANADDSRVPLLRKRLKIEGDETIDQVRPGRGRCREEVPARRRPER